MHRFFTYTAAVTTACAAGRAAAQSPRPQPPLAPYVAQRVAVMPVQLLRSDTGALVTAGAWNAFRRELDDSIGSAIAARGLGSKWAYATDVARAAKRNMAYVSDPYTLGAQSLVRIVYKSGDRIPELFASNLRSQIAVGDARFALVPVELAFVRIGRRQRATLRVVLVDGRGGLFMWVGDVASDPVDVLSPLVLTSLAARVADLVAAP